MLRRGVTFTCNKPGYSVIGLTHPSGSATGPNRICYGRYGTFLAYAKDPDSGVIPEGQTVGINLSFLSNAVGSLFFVLIASEN